MKRYYDNRRIYTKEGKENFEPIFNSGYSGMPQSLFYMARIVLALMLIICLPMLILAFKQTIAPFLFFGAIFAINEAICRKFGWHRLNDDDVDYWDKYGGM